MKKQNTITKVCYQSPLGLLEIQADPTGILSLGPATQKTSSSKDLPECVQDCIRQLDEYFQGKRQNFSLQLNLQGTPFQKEVWRQLLKIPFGKKVSYSQIAERAKNPKAVRAVGTAIGSNPVGIIVPCHRVIAKSGGLGGYAWGLPKKTWLLKHEQKYFLS